MLDTLISVGARVRHYGQQYPRAYDTGTGIVTAIHDDGRGTRFIEYDVRWDSDTATITNDATSRVNHEALFLAEDQDYGRYSDDDLDSMFQAYLVAAVWTGLDYYAEGEEPRELDENYSVADIADETRAQLFGELAEFLNLAEQADLDRFAIDQIGHDFCLTRNHHGAGFWDRGMGAAGTRLTEVAHSMGGSDLYVRDGEIFAE